MWVTPAYIALLADRRGIRTPGPQLDATSYQRALHEARPDYFFVSVYHPRNTLDDSAWRAGLRAMEVEERVQVVHVRPGRDGTPASSMLFRLAQGASKPQ